MFPFSYLFFVRDFFIGWFMVGSCWAFFRLQCELKNGSEGSEGSEGIPQ